jgi:hypothetical protein
MDAVREHRDTAREADPRVGRAVGGLGVLLLLMVVLALGGGPMFTDASNAEIVRWVHGHVGELYLQGYLEGLAMLLNAVFLGALLWRARVTGHLRAAAYGLIGASLAIDMVGVSIEYALGKSADRGVGDGTLVGLFGFAEQLTFTDGTTWGLVIGIVSVVSLRRRALVRPVCWLGILVAVLHLVGTPVQLVLNGTPEGVTGPIGTALLLLWWLATSLSLLVRPVPVGASTTGGADSLAG